MKVGLIGAGNMGKALIDGLVDEKDIEIRASNLEAETYKGVQIESGANKKICSWADIIILAVKPKFMSEVIGEVKEMLQEKIVITVAAILDIHYYQEQGIEKIIRYMPNVAVGKQAGVIGFCASKACSAEEKKTAFRLAERLGYCVAVKEEHLDTIVALSGSGIAYLTHILGLFIEEGKKAGLSSEESTQIIIETVKGSSTLLSRGEEAQSICSRVATKGGITEQGLKLMQEEGLDEIIKNVSKKTIDACKP